MRNLGIIVISYKTDLGRKVRLRSYCVCSIRPTKHAAPDAGVQHWRLLEVCAEVAVLLVRVEGLIFSDEVVWVDPDAAAGGDGAAAGADRPIPRPTTKSLAQQEQEQEQQFRKHQTRLPPKSHHYQ